MLNVMKQTAVLKNTTMPSDFLCIPFLYCYIKSLTNCTILVGIQILNKSLDFLLNPICINCSTWYFLPWAWLAKPKANVVIPKNQPLPKFLRKKNE